MSLFTFLHDQRQLEGAGGTDRLALGRIMRRSGPSHRRHSESLSLETPDKYLLRHEFEGDRI
jgi:hypothetical protein